MIVVHPPPIHNVPRLRQVQQQLTIQAFITQLPVEAFDIPVLPRTARLDEQRLDARRSEPRLDRLASELRTIVAPDASRASTDHEQFIQRSHHIRAREVPTDLDRQALTRILIDHRQHPESTAALRPIADEVITPHMVLTQRPMTMAGIDS